ncbi:MAG: ammonia-forming cytochrome c nitrite reductase subunit c552 [Bacillota bacterium]|nr:ammonia-forming cytochrome c nitrite reductase subunit c552 [Bacillota bacterium]MDW7684171.1 ammonia-forming cytochrome c nitrite reductase subunit c552 [Bacillota bacterium]
MTRKVILTAFLLLLMTASVHAQSENCTACHSDMVSQYLAGPHAGIDCIRCHQNGEEHTANPQAAPGVEVQADNCGECHQLQFESYMEGEGTDQTRQKQEEFPLLRRLLAGHPFAEDYREPRSHINMLTDFVQTSRPRSALCMYCKSSDVYWQWNDTINYESNAGELLDNNVIANPITCVQCHNPHVPELRVVQPALNEAIERMPQEHPGRDDPMGSRVCSQCHVNYNFNPAARGIEFPFVKVAQMPDYINSTEIWRETGTGGWEHPEAGIMLYKVQHPETELYWDSLHHKLGVSCADCHMPKRTAENGETYTQHWLTSPLNHIEEGCLNCHSQPPEELRENVKNIQQDIYSRMQDAMSVMDVTLDNLATAAETPNVDEDSLSLARQNYFMAHLYWEWIAAENSAGFHNPTEARSSLEQAVSFATDAREQSAEAIGAKPSPPAEEVPPARSFPWVPVLLGLSVVAGILAYFIKYRKIRE